jgi:hypothetical protein
MAFFSGWCIHGRLRCPICMGDSQAYRLKHGKKETFFDVHRCLLPSNHPFINDTKSFRKSKRVRDGPPKRQTGEDIMRQHHDLKPSAGGGFEGYGEHHNWTHISFLWELPYMNALLLPHNIDLMHQERNVTESIISMCFDFTGQTKDNIKARRDLAKLCDRPHLEVRQNPSGYESRPRAPYCLMLKEREEIFQWLKI